METRIKLLYLRANNQKLNKYTAMLIEECQRLERINERLRQENELLHASRFSPYRHVFSVN